MRHKNLRQSLWYIKVDILSLRKKGLYWDYGKNVDCFNCVKWIFLFMDQSSGNRLMNKSSDEKSTTVQEDCR